MAFMQIFRNNVREYIAKLLQIFDMRKVIAAFSMQLCLILVVNVIVLISSQEYDISM